MRILLVSIILTGLFLKTSQVTNVNAMALENPPFIISSGNNEVTSGILYEILQEISKRTQIDVTYFLFPNTESNVEQLIANSSYDVAIGFPFYGEYSENLSHNVEAAILLTDYLYVFRPNLLSIFISTVFKEMFFIVFVIFLPWIMIAVGLYYLIENKQFSRQGFTQGLINALWTILGKTRKPTTCGKIFCIFFYIISFILLMLLSGDFIYVIAAMLLKAQPGQIDQFSLGSTGACIVQGDYLAENYFTTSAGASITVQTTVQACFDLLASVQVGSVYVSQTIVENFFKDNPLYNNNYDFLQRTTLFDQYLLMVRQDLNIYNQINEAVEDMETTFIPDVIKEYCSTITFDDLTPSSILSDSIALIYSFITITAICIIVFFAILICKPKDRPTERRRRLLYGGSEKRKSGKRTKEFPTNEDQESSESRREQEYPVPVLYSNKRNKTLSLSGPIKIKKIDGKIEKSWENDGGQVSREEGSVKFQVNSNYEDQISSVENEEESGLASGGEQNQMN